MTRPSRSTFTPNEMAALAKLAKLPLDEARRGALIEQVGGLLGCSTVWTTSS